MSATAARAGLPERGAMRAPAPASLDILLEVETPEQIAFSYSIAGIGSRGAAALIDLLACVGIFLGLLLLFALVGISALFAHATRGLVSSAAWAIAILVLLQSTILWAYYVLFEGMNDGQTPGKRVMRLRVVRDGGYAVSFAASAARNLVRIVDILPAPLYGVGIITALLNPARKRLGDLVAGTIVIHERAPLAPAHRGTSAPREQAPVTRIAAALTDEEYGVLERYFARRNALAPERRRQLATELARRLMPRLDGPVAADDAPAMLVRLFERERDARASGVASRSDRGARREQHALVALGLKRWNDFADALDAAQRRGLDHMPPEEVSALAARYREITTDLARLQTASRGRPSDALFYLNRLVAGGHALLYRERSHTVVTSARFLLDTVPAEIRRSWRPIALAAALLFGPAVAAYATVVHDPATADAFVGDEMASRARLGASRERRGEGYVTINAGVRPIVASAIISNNVRISYLAFALGVTGGIGTALVLIFNGVSLGGGLGVFATQRVLHMIVAFVAPHGVLELSAICIAAGGGFLLGAALLLPGDRARRDALVENGRRAVTLLAGSTLFLLIAGAIEGLLSPRVWPLGDKLLVSLGTAVGIALYLAPRRRTATAEGEPGIRDSGGEPGVRPTAPHAP